MENDCDYDFIIHVLLVNRVQKLDDGKVNDGDHQAWMPGSSGLYMFKETSSLLPNLYYGFTAAETATSVQCICKKICTYSKVHKHLESDTIPDILLLYITTMNLKQRNQNKIEV